MPGRHHFHERRPRGVPALVLAGDAQNETGSPMIKIAPARIDANALKMSVNWALLALPIDIDVTT